MGRELAKKTILFIHGHIYICHVLGSKSDTQCWIPPPGISQIHCPCTWRLYLTLETPCIFCTWTVRLSCNETSWPSFFLQTSCVLLCSFLHSPEEGGASLPSLGNPTSCSSHWFLLGKQVLEEEEEEGSCATADGMSSLLRNVAITASSRRGGGGGGRVTHLDAQGWRGGGRTGWAASEGR